jgi:hypothetical protein
MQRYLVQCWISPQSGFDLARKNHTMEIFRKVLESHFEYADYYEGIEKAMTRFEKTHDGLILEPIVLETDEDVTDCEAQLMPEIRKKYPEAKLLNCQPWPINV